MAAQSGILILQSGQSLDVTSIDKWTEALLRYVLNANQGDYNPEPDERTHAQYIENLQFKIDAGATVDLLNSFIAAIEDSLKYVEDLDDDIQWSPIFDKD